MEEALNALESDSAERDKPKAVIDEFFDGEEIYRSYIDDPWNTDNAWIENYN